MNFEYKIILSQQIYLCYSFSIFSQINGLEGTLNKESHNSDLKKVRVNAQVTAINTIIEMIFSVTYIIVLAVMKGTSLVSYVYAQLYYNILLPAIFLSNTSDNKFRIVELGWTNVFKNIINSMKVQTLAYSQIITDSLDVLLIFKKKGLEINCPDAVKEFGTENGNPDEHENNDAIFMTRTVQNDIVSKDTDQLNVPMSSSNRENSEKSITETTSRSYELLDASKLNPNNHDLQSMEKKILILMIQEINFEEKYLVLFKNLVAQQQGYIVNESSISKDLQKDELSRSFSAIQKNKGKRKGKNLIHHESRKGNQEAHPNHLDNSNFKISSNVKDRIQMRKSVLVEPQLLQADAVRELVDQLITLEESFLKED